MQTFYVDIYFFINFTVDLLALHFSSVLSRVPINGLKLTFLSIFLSAFACFRVLMLDDGSLIDILCFLLCVTVIFITLYGISILRRIRLLFLYLIFNFLIGGIVSFIYEKLKAILGDEGFDKEINHTLLLFATAMLLVFGILKIFITLFANKLSEKCARVKIELLERSLTFDCLVDSGNLLVDPIDSTPVLLVKEDIWKNLVSEEYKSIKEMKEGIYSKYIRLIPIKKEKQNEILYGLRPDKAYIITKKGEEEIRLVFTLDESDGSFAGYSGLLPAVLLEGLE